MARRAERGTGIDGEGAVVAIQESRLSLVPSIASIGDAEMVRTTRIGSHRPDQWIEFVLPTEPETAGIVSSATSARN